MAKRRAQEKAALAGLYAAFGQQFPRLKKALTAQRYKLEALQGQAQKAIGTSPFDLQDLDWSDEESLLTADLEPVFRSVLKEAVLTMALDAANLGVQVSWEVYNAKAAEYARQYSYGLIKQINDSTRTQMGQTIGRWIESGEPFPALVDRVWKLVPANPFPNMRDRAQVIAATETTRVFADTQRLALSAAGLKRWRWRTAEDEAVCLTCGPMGRADGGEGAIGNTETGMFLNPSTGDHVEMPAHPACRCFAVADVTELEERAQEVPADAPTKAEVTAAAEPVATDSFKSFANIEEAQQWAGKEFADWTQSLSASETKAFKYYQSTEYRPINRHLRKGAKLDKENLGFIQKMDEALSRSVIGEDVVTHRGFSTQWYVDHFDDLAGTVVQDKGFVSTSLDRSIGEKFAAWTREEDKIPIIAEIRVPKGARGAYLGGIIQGQEVELLLPRDSLFRILSTSTDNEGVKHLIMELLNG